MTWSVLWEEGELQDMPKYKIEMSSGVITLRFLDWQLCAAAYLELWSSVTALDLNQVENGAMYEPIRTIIWKVLANKRTDGSDGRFNTPQNAPLERPACFAFPELGSSWHKYCQPTGYHYFTNNPVLLNMLHMPGVMSSMHQYRYHAYNEQAY